MICDQIVVGLLDNGLSEKMQQDPNLTLERAVSVARQSKAVHKQQKVHLIKVASWSPDRATKLSQLHKNTFNLEKQPQLGNLQKVREHRTSVPGVEKHYGTTDNSVLQRMLTVINVRNWTLNACYYSRQISSVTETTDKHSLELLNQAVVTNNN